MNKLDVREQVITCTACALHKRCTAPVPWSGPVPARIAVLGEAPGRQEDEAGEPFVGPAGRLLRDGLTNVGLDVTSIAFINTASCWPRKEDGKGRAPLPAEVEACAANREAQLDLVGARFVLLTGNVPLQAYRWDLKITKARAHPFDRNGRRHFPIFHPAAILRNPGWRRDFDADLMLFAKMLQDDDFMPEPTCVYCARDEEQIEWWRFDDEGIPYCDKCWVLSPQGRRE